MAQYQVTDSRGVKYGFVEASSEGEAIQKAKVLHKLPLVERVLSRGERLQKQYDDEVKLWEAMNPESKIYRDRLIARFKR